MPARLDLDLASEGAGSRLLDRMRKLMGEQLLTSGPMRREATTSEDEVLPDRVRLGIDRVSRVGRARIRVHPDLAEIMMKT